MLLNETRYNRLNTLLDYRQANLTVVLENIHDPQNISAVMRTADAVGIHEIFVINTTEATYKVWGKKSSASAYKWVKVHLFKTVAEAMQAVAKNYPTIYGTALHQQSESLYATNLTFPTAIAFGNEHSGLSPEMQTYCKGFITIPMVGMVQSLNISVACSVCLYEAFRQKQLAGHYHTPQLPNQLREAYLTDWSLNKKERFRISK
jgi:tRNA (guanosine-2'-O-)-methyltransferase